MNILPVLTHLRDELPTLTIEAPTQLQSLERESYPVAQVVPGDESVSETLGVSIDLITLLDCELHVYVVAEAARVTTDSDPLADALLDVRAILIGYQHSDWVRPLTLVRGEIVALDAGRIAWRDTYSTQRALSANVVTA